MPAVHIIRCGFMPILYIFILLCTAFQLELKAEDSATPKTNNILIINSYDPEYTWTRTIIDGIRKGLADYGPKGARLSIEHLDARRFPNATIVDHFASLIAEKYTGAHKPDIIIAVDNAAYSFMRKNGATLFGKTPVVFCGVSAVSPEGLRYAPQVTGIAGNSSAFGDTVRTIRMMMPKVKKIIFLTDYSATGQELAQEARDEFIRHRFGLESFGFTENLSAEKVAESLAALPNDTAVVHLFYSRDSEGRTFDLAQSAEFFSSRSAVPIFGTLNLTLGHGIIGGKLTDGEVIGRKVMEFAARILRGENPSDIPLIIGLEMPIRFDYHQLRHHGLSPSDLPDGSEIFFEPPNLKTLYNNHFWLFWEVIALLVFQGGMIGLLLRQRARLINTRTQLHEAQQLYYSLVNDPPVCINRVLLDGTLDYVNNYCCKFFQKKRSELLGRNFLEFALPADRNRMLNFLAALRTSPENPMLSIELEHHLPDGQKRHIRWISRAVFNLHGQLETIQSIGEDITDLKQTYAVLVENEKRFRTVADFTCGWESWLSPEDVLLYISPFCEVITGYTPEEFRRTPQLFLTTVYPDDRRIFERHWRERTTGTCFNYRLQHKSGKIVWVEYTGQPVEGEEQNPQGWRISIRDITERKQAEEALRDSEENLRITLQSISDAVISADLAGAVRSMNSAAETLCGCIFSDIAGINLSQALHLHDLHTGERVNNLCEYILSSHTPNPEARQLTLKSPTGAQHIVAVTGSPIRNAASIVVGTVLILRDITQQIEMEEQLRHTQKMDAIGQLAGGVAHDFNNMLGGIMGASELILAKGGDNPAICRYADIVIRTAERASKLTEQLLAFSRKGSEYARPVDMHAVIRDAREILESSIDKRILLQTWLEAEDFNVRGDPSQLENALINLCLNARDAMPDGGELNIETKNIMLGEDAPVGPEGPLPAGRYLRLSVTDNGAGIDPGIISNIFDPFFTTKEVGKGTGLGLSAVYGIVRYHHGAITVDSIPGTGTCFILYLPVLNEHSAETQSTTPPLPPQGEGVILLVDDEAPIRQTAGMLLESCGYIVHTASDGQESLDLFRQNPALYDLVLLDMVMPDIDGSEVFRIMRSIRPDVRVVISSGYLRDARISTLLEEGVWGYLKKPYRLPELASTVAQVLHADKILPAQNVPRPDA